MTLIIYIHCTDAVILASDRKESNVSDVGQAVQKYYMPTNQEFVLALAGEGTRIEMIFSELHRNRNIAAATVLDELHRIIDGTNVKNVNSMASGLLLIRNGNDLEFNDVQCSDHAKSITKNKPLFKHYGDGSYLVDYLIRKFDLSNRSWKESYPYVVAIIDAVARHTDSVGSVSDYGVNVLVFANGRLPKANTIHSTKGIGEIRCTCDIGGWLDMQSESESMPKVQVEGKAAHGTIAIKADDGDYSLECQISSGTITSIKPLKDANALLIFLDTTSNGELTITIPRSLIDAMVGHHNDALLVLCDNEQIQVRETITKTDRTVTIPFNAGCKEIEIIGNELFGERAGSARGSKGYSAEEMGRVAREREAPIAIQTDRGTYTYGSEIVVTITNLYFIASEQMDLRITDDKGNAMYESMIPVSEIALGIYQEIVRIEGREWTKTGTAFEVSVAYLDKKVSTRVTIKQSEMTVELDRRSYSWISTAGIKITAPDLPTDPSKAAKLSDVDGCFAEISTSRGKLSGYDLVETKMGAGIFVGRVRLTGFPGHDIYGDTRRDSVSGETGGSGPYGGRIGCFGKDTLTVTLVTHAGMVSSSAVIRWKLGDIYWLETAYPPSGTGTLLVVDPDMSLDPEGNNEVEVRVWSDSDPVGIRLWITDSEYVPGTFMGTVHFTAGQSSSPNLKVSEGDRITAKYIDRTLPEQYKSDELPITSSSFIRGRFLPTKKVRVKNTRLCDMLGHTVERVTVNQEVNIMANLTNTQGTEQKFVCLVQITYPNGARSRPSPASGLLAPHQSQIQSVTWKPTTPGMHAVTIYVWESINNPVALSEPLKMPVNVEGDDDRHQPYKKVEQATAHAEAYKPPSIPVISIPLGTSVPGCEESNNCYVPSNLTVRANKNVVWTNDDNASHTITSGTVDKGADGSFDSGLIPPGSSFLHKFVRKGTYRYFCTVHPWQAGVVVVE